MIALISFNIFIQNNFDCLEMKRLGERIKRKREDLHMQLNELAKKVGISSSALSQIEKAKALPSITNLKHIADNLHTTVGELIGENEALSNNPLTHIEDISFIEENESGCASYLFLNHGSKKQMDTLLLKLNQGANSQGIVKLHPGQTFLFVLEGQVTIQLEDKTYRLIEKDSFYFNSNRYHLIENIESKQANIILVSTPPVG